ncbi:MAG: chemotaxis protein CheW [Planctomycetaceae bacterium]|nr:chemotaxis protein CheW [Planctomycetaceae bacterium]
MEHAGEGAELTAASTEPAAGTIEPPAIWNDEIAPPPARQQPAASSLPAASVTSGGASSASVYSSAGTPAAADDTAPQAAASPGIVSGGLAAGCAAAGEAGPAETASDPVASSSASSVGTHSQTRPAGPAGRNPVPPRGTLPEQPAEQTDEPGTEKPQRGVADLSIRVGIDVLDSLMNLVGELVLTRNQLLQLARGDEESRYAGPIVHLNRVTTDLQEGVMKTRMQPIGNAWAKLPRLVRDLTHVTGHQVQLEMTGAETELDRTVLDAIKDPLTHMVRNSVDHGIEPPEVRLQQGKPESGTIRLSACHEGGHVIICIEDDGGGINTARVLEKAISKGLVNRTQASGMSQNEILTLIFTPGFSTADRISAVSGRGVGMDVVRTQIERIGGVVDLTSTEGQGTTIRIRIPLTLAIISALVVESGGQSFAIPQLGVVELVRLSSEARKRIERINDQEVFRLRDRLLPLIHLNRLLELEELEDSERDTNIVVVQVGEEQFGLIVYDVFDTEEIVVKPMGQMLKDIPVYQGTTILGDGRVIMILDVAGISAELGTTSRGLENRSDKDQSTEAVRNTTSLLKFRANSTTMAVPLSLVARLEEFPLSTIERSSSGLVVQYRNDLLPLLPLHSDEPATELADPQPVIVFSEGTHSMGLLVSEIQDILDEHLVIRKQRNRPGILGTAIVSGHATDIIDTNYYITAAQPDWFDHHSTPVDPVLIVDDSLFFRQLATTALEASGWRTVSVQNGQAAIDLLESDRRFCAVLTDLELATVSGLELAGWIRSRRGLEKLPIIALTSLDRSIWQPLALQAGCDCFLSKFNAQLLLSSLTGLTQPDPAQMIGATA